MNLDINTLGNILTIHSAPSGSAQMVFLGLILLGLVMVTAASSSWKALKSGSSRFRLGVGGAAMIGMPIFMLLTEKTVELRCDGDRKVLALRSSSLLSKSQKEIPYAEISGTHIIQSRTRRKGRERISYMPVLVLKTGENVEIISSYRSNENEAVRCCAAVNKALGLK